MRSVFMLLVLSLNVFSYSTNGGGTLTGQEKGDAMYRVVGMPVDDYHASLFGEFYVEDGKPHTSVIELNLNGGLTCDDEVIDGTHIEAHCNKRNTDDYTDVARIQWVFKPLLDEPHSKVLIDKLSKAARVIYGEKDDAEYIGAFTNTGAVLDGSLTGAKRSNILNEAMVNMGSKAASGNWGYTATDMVDYNMGLWTYFRGLEDIDDVRCDFITEWAYEKNGVLVWGKDSDLRWISGGGTEHADYHNNFVDDNDSYYYDEVSPIVQSGDLKGNSRDARTRTTFRPSIVEEPAIEYFSFKNGEMSFSVVENASEQVYFSILLFKGGVFSQYAQDANGNDFKYRPLILTDQIGIRLKQAYYPQLKDMDVLNEYEVKLVVTDEGANTSEVYLGYEQINIVPTIITPLLLN